MGRHSKHRNTNRPHLPAWVKTAAPYVWRLIFAMAPAAVAAVMR